MILCGTGHRPDKLGGHSPEVAARLKSLAIAVLKKTAPSTVISGMALGWDIALAKASIALEIPLIAAVPFAGQELFWPKDSQDCYNAVLAKASRVHIVCDGSYHPSKMQIRNEWMVNESGLVCALWDGSAGGTRNCVRYAIKKNIQILNVWKSWVKFH